MKHRPPTLDVRLFYDRFDAPVTAFDCGARCSPHNPGGKPFCCDICHAVPAVYRQEWSYLRENTDLWRVWQGDECAENPEDPRRLLAETPKNMLLLACLGPDRCQRTHRALSCRQFPFFPYITSGGRFIGLAYEWAFEESCWVISNLREVTDSYRQQFIQAYGELFSLWPDEFTGYAVQSEEMRVEYHSRRRCIPLLHRDGGYWLVGPASERMRRLPPERLPRFGRYQEQRARRL